MKSIKCPNCGLVSFETQIICKRCQSSLHVSDSSAIENKSNLRNSQNTWTITRNQEIGVGVFLFLAGVFLVAMNWMDALYREKFHAGMTIMAPVAVAGGLSLIVFPFPQKEYFPKAEYAPKEWAYFLIPSFILGVLNWLYFMGIV